MIIQKFISILLLLIASFVCALEEGEEAPKFVNPDLDAKYVFSKNFIGKTWIIVDFFATDCEGCKKELPEVEKLYEEFRDLGVVAFLFAVDEEGPDIVKPYFEKKPTKLTVLIDRYKKTAINFGVDEIPALFLINPEGKIILKRIEYAEVNVKDMKRILVRALLPEDTIDNDNVQDEPEDQEMEEEG